MKKPTRKELIDALELLASWAVGHEKDGNPYTKPEVRNALTVLGREKGVDYLYPFFSKKDKQ